MSDRLSGIQELLQKEQNVLKERQHTIQLWSGKKLQYHIQNRSQTLELDLKSYIPSDFSHLPLEVEIGPGKGEFLAARAKQFPERYFLGIDRRLDRVQLTEKKLKRNEHANWQIIREDACSFSIEKLPKIDVLHLYQPDPWPKFKHHKHRFFRSPEAEGFALNIKQGGELRVSTDHIAYFYEMLERIKTWECFAPSLIIEKKSFMSPALSHFESLFLKKNEPVFKAHFVRK